MKRSVILFASMIFVWSLFLSSSAISQFAQRAGYSQQDNKLNFDLYGKTSDRAGLYGCYSASMDNSALFSVGVGNNFVSSPKLLLSAGALYNHYDHGIGGQLGLQLEFKIGIAVNNNVVLIFAFTGDKAITGSSAFAKEKWLQTFQSKAKLFFDFKSSKDGIRIGSFGAITETLQGKSFYGYGVEFMFSTHIGIYGDCYPWGKSYYGEQAENYVLQRVGLCFNY